MSETSIPIAKLAGVCGWPIHHSLSPVLHNYWLRQAGIRGAYVPFMVKPWDAIRAFRSLKQTTISGVNVTLPLKTSAFRAADEATADAHRIGVANCLFMRDGKLIAHNTDMEGFISPLLQRRGQAWLRQQTALVIGAGGAARAVIGALIAEGVPEIIIVNRTDETADDLVTQAGLPSFYALPWTQRSLATHRAGLIINASAAGMSGYPALDIDLSRAPETGLVYDLIYTPERTPLIAQAEAQGLETIGGLCMLIGQARPSFRLFYGVEAPASDPSDLLRQALMTGQR